MPYKRVQLSQGISIYKGLLYIHGVLGAFACRLLTAATLLYEATAGLDPHSARSFLSDAGLWTHLDQIETGSNSGRPSFLLASGDEFPLPSFRYTVLCSRRAPRTAQPYASATPHMLRQKSSTSIAMSTGKGNLMAKGT